MSAPRNSIYDEEILRAIGPGSRRSASVVVPIVNTMLNPTSVVDFGCGDGSWLSAWYEAGVRDLVGLDDADIPREQTRVSERIERVDLRCEVDLRRQFDLAMCLEVGEHLPADAAQSLVSSLARHSDNLLFSAAAPGQGGVGHVNEQPPGYWIELLGNFGFRLCDVLRPLLWDDLRIQVWYRQNMLLFIRGPGVEFRGLADMKSFGGRHVVHPEILEAYRYPKGVRPSAVQLVSAIGRAIGRRKRRFFPVTRS